MLQVKGNHPRLRAAIQARHAADPAAAGRTCRVRERRSGRRNTWQVSFYPDPDPDLALAAAWAGLAGFVVVAKTVAYRGVSTRTAHYYRTSLSTRPVAELAAGIRGHWGIENKLHRTRDVHFRQDTNGIRNRTAAVNVAVFNTLALNYLVQNVHPSMSYAQLYYSQNFKQSIPCYRT